MTTRARALSILAAAVVAAGIGALMIFQATSRPNASADQQAAARADADMSHDPDAPPTGSSDEPSGPMTHHEISAGSVAAPFALNDLDGHKVTLASLHGKIVFLNVWATWCEPCRVEMPSIETLYTEFKKNPEIVVLAVSEDQAPASEVAAFVKKNGYHFPVLLDPKNKITDDYSLSGVPETFIIDRDGRIVAHHMGAFDWSRQDVKDALRELLNSKEVSRGSPHEG